MPYARKELQILGGGFNLLPPGDKTPATDYLLAQNWRADREGKLVSRDGYVQKFSINGMAFAHSAAVFGGVEGAYYVAGPTPTLTDAAVSYNFASPSINGFDANRVAMVPMNGWMWLMNRGKAGRHNATGYRQWGLTAPASGPTLAAGTANADGPDGTYQIRVTFSTADDSCESNPSPASSAVLLSLHDAIISGIPTSGDALVTKRSLYATGGTLGQPYLIGVVPNNTSTVAVFNTTDLAANPGAALLSQWNDAIATNTGIAMPTNNDPPPLASGMVGPYFGRLIAFSVAANVNRLFWTDPNKPGYWPGAADPAIGNWVDVGMDGEAIIWCTIHTNVLVIYKERSIWRLVGDPDTGYLEQVQEGLGLVSPFAVVSAGQVDYFVGPNGLFRNNLDHAQDITGPIRPLFNAYFQNPGDATRGLTRPGSILPGPNYFSNSLHCYGAVLGYAMGKLYIAFQENVPTPTTANNSCPILVYHEQSGRWMYHRFSTGYVGFQGFVFDGIQMVALTGNGNALSQGFNVDDFINRYVVDPGGTMECVFQSHYEDAGLPDNQKNWLEVVIDYEFVGDTATVYVGYDNGSTALTSVGTITGTGRRSSSFALGTDGVLAKNISVAVKGIATAGQIILHNVYLYYYEEARLGLAASTIPTDLGAPRVKQCKELQLDIEAAAGTATAHIYSDLPGNAIALRQTVAIAQNGRAVWKYPFAVTEGFLWRLALSAAQPFRLYSARLLMRVIGVYVEAYEAAAGFVWDSMEMAFESGLTHIPRGSAISLAAQPIKRAREITLEIDTFNASVTITFLSDLPGNAMASRFTTTINSGTAGRRFVRLPLPAGLNAPVEGRMFRLQLSGAAKFVLYGASVEILAVGVYVEAYEATAGAVYDSREMDFGTPAVKEARELEIDIETAGSVTVGVISDLTSLFSATISTTGRQKVMVPLTVSAALEQFVEGRFLRLLLTGTHAYALYGARIRVRLFGQYLLAAETSGGAVWDTTDLDLGTQKVKQLREIELDIWAYGSYTVTLYTDLPGNAMASRVVSNQAPTSGRTKVQIPLPQGSVPDNYTFGRLVRVVIASAYSFKLFGARIHARPIGLYVESYEAAGGAVWDSTPSDLGNPSDKILDQVRLEMDSDSAVMLTVYTDLPGETFATRGNYTLAAGSSARHWATVPLPDGTEGRSIRLVASSAGGFRIYKAQVRAARIGRYLAGGADALHALEFDFQSERVKAAKKLEVDLRSDSPVTLQLFTNQGGTLAQVYTTTLAATTGRQSIGLVLPPGIRGRLMRIVLTGGPARIFRVRVWGRPLNEPQASWAWIDYPLEESDALPAWSELPVEETPPTFSWSDLPVEPTKPEWAWAPFPVNPTEPQWFWAKVLAVDETPDKWEWVDVPFQVTG